MTLGRSVKAKRIAEGLSLRDLERLVGVSFSSLSRLESGKGKPTHESLNKVLADYDAIAQNEGGHAQSSRGSLTP